MEPPLEALLMFAVASFALFFAAVHPLVSGSPLRAALVGRLGEARYRGLFALLSTVGVVGLIVAYHYAPVVPVWSPPLFVRHLAALTMLAAFLIGVVGMVTRSPTSAGGEKLFHDEEPAKGILRVTRHPFLMAVVLWSGTHLLTRGDAASMWFFASFLFLGVTGPGRIDRRQRAQYGAEWERFAARTSVIPLGAIVGGRNRLALGEIGAGRIAAALAAYLVTLLVGHRLLFGVAPLPISIPGLG